MLRGKTDAETCRLNGFVAGDLLVGDEGFGPTVIRITAIGDEKMLAVGVSHNGKHIRPWETTWTLTAREWRKLHPQDAAIKEGE